MREELEHRPLLAVALALAIGLGAASHWALLLLAAALLVAVRPTSLRAIALVAACIGFVIAPPLPREGLLDSVYVHQIAHVLTMPAERPEGSTAVLQAGDLRLQAFLPGNADIGMGDTLHIEGVAQPLTESMDAWALSEGIVGRISLEPDQFLVVQSGPWLYQAGAAGERACST